MDEGDLSGKGRGGGEGTVTHVGGGRCGYEVGRVYWMS